MDNYHIPVMLNEALDNLKIKPDGKYIDCTLGGGGHSLAIIKSLSNNGFLLSLDWDDDSINYVKNIKTDLVYEARWELKKTNFLEITKVIKEINTGKVDGVLFDLGMSSHQIEETDRGFSFRADAELDMRMDRDLSLKAVDLVNGLYVKEIEKLLKVYGEEPNARRIAAEIGRARKINRIKTTLELLNVIQKVVPFKVRRKTAMRVFQALRIAVNDEINNLSSGLPQALELLASGGRCVVISFHSLEDRVVKNIFKDYEDKKMGLRITRKPILPSEEEILENNRSRSAKIRVFEKL